MKIDIIITVEINIYDYLFLYFITIFLIVNIKFTASDG